MYNEFRKERRGDKKMKGYHRRLLHSRVAVVAERKGKSNTFVVIPGHVQVVPQNTELVCPDKITVVTEDGEELPPTGYYAITAGTIDPFHLLLDMF